MTNGDLRIGELARRTGTSPELLRAWERRYGLLRPSRSAGGFRLYSYEDAARVEHTKALIAQGVATAEAARRVLSSVAVDHEVSVPAEEVLAAELSDALDRFDEEAANRALDRLFAMFSIEAVLQDVLLPYLRILGERWAANEASVAQEHFASTLIRGRLLGLARGWGGRNGPTLLLACPPGEEHDLGLIMFGIVAARRGWRISYLGQNTPLETIEQAVGVVRPALVVLAVAEGTLVSPHVDALRSLGGRVSVAIGGAGTRREGISSLGLRILDGDPVEAARALTT